LAPIDGTITHINSKVIGHPELLNQEPYHDGWLFVVEPNALKNDLKGLLYGKEAHQWLLEEKDRLVTHIQSDIGATALDGGMPAQDFAGHLKGKKWAHFVRQFLLS
jgi:hypothetical protein